MRILVDESLPRHFAAEITGHDVSTVREQGWLGLKNGVLLRAAAENGFDVLVTADRSVEFQQNLEKIGIAVVILGGRNRLPDLVPLVPVLHETLATIEPGQVSGSAANQRVERTSARATITQSSTLVSACAGRSPSTVME